MKLILSILISLNTISVIYSQEADQLFVRLVKIEIEPDALAQYTELLNQQMNTAVKLEEGVLEYRVVNEKENTHRFTLIEIYRDYESYLSHIKTPHFLKYKNSSQDMVKSLELIDANLIGRTKKD
ncbi:MAG: antibiotic biosynthesis monooxygenase [Flavobacteriaceae bacterium]|nr:antibiotic biosynthesis monooxygenase [Flavobacteriaceae bacterium]